MGRRPGGRGPIWGVIPVKRLDRAKRRLAPVLDGTARAELMLRMFDRVLAAMLGAPGIAGALVVSADAAVRARAAERGATALADPPDADLNAALTAGAVWLAGRGAAAMLILPADLPLAESEDVMALLDAWAGEETMALVRAKDGEGTGALLCRLPCPFPLAFGPRSADRHLAAARGAHLLSQEIARPKLAFDLDDPQDLQVLGGNFGGPGTMKMGTTPTP